MSELLYKPGDTVIIRSDLKGDTEYPVLYGPAAGERTLYCNNNMATLGGKTFEIDQYTFDEAFYELKGSCWNWTESMFENPKECICHSLL